MDRDHLITQLVQDYERTKSERERQQREDRMRKEIKMLVTYDLARRQVDGGLRI